MRILYANTISVIGRVLSEKVTGNQVVRFVLNLGVRLRIKWMGKVLL